MQSKGTRGKKQMALSHNLHSLPPNPISALNVKQIPLCSYPQSSSCASPGFVFDPGSTGPQGLLPLVQGTDFTRGCELTARKVTSTELDCCCSPKSCVCVCGGRERQWITFTMTCCFITNYRSNNIRVCISGYP